MTRDGGRQSPKIARIQKKREKRKNRRRQRLSLCSRPFEEKNFIVDATKPVKVPATNLSIDLWYDRFFLFSPFFLHSFPLFASPSFDRVRAELEREKFRTGARPPWKRPVMKCNFPPDFVQRRRNRWTSASTSTGTRGISKVARAFGIFFKSGRELRRQPEVARGSSKRSFFSPLEFSRKNRGYYDVKLSPITKNVQERSRNYRVRSLSRLNVSNVYRTPAGVCKRRGGRWATPRPFVQIFPRANNQVYIY